jgi:hypothetical protein
MKVRYFLQRPMRVFFLPEALYPTSPRRNSVAPKGKGVVLGDPSDVIKDATPGPASFLRKSLSNLTPERATERAFERAWVIWPLFPYRRRGRRIDPGPAIPSADRAAGILPLAKGALS